MEYALSALFLYLGCVNFVSAVLVCTDKRRAETGGRRIRERTLLFPCFLGGSLGGLLAMLLVRHKTRKRKFTAGVPLLLLLNILCALFILYIIGGHYGKV